MISIFTVYSDICKKIGACSLADPSIQRHHNLISKWDMG